MKIWLIHPISAKRCRLVNKNFIKNEVNGK